MSDQHEATAAASRFDRHRLGRALYPAASASRIESRFVRPLRAKATVKFRAPVKAAPRAPVAIAPVAAAPDTALLDHETQLALDAVRSGLRDLAASDDPTSLAAMDSDLWDSIARGPEFVLAAADDTGPAEPDAAASTERGPAAPEFVAPERVLPALHPTAARASSRGRTFRQVALAASLAALLGAAGYVGYGQVFATGQGGEAVVAQAAPAIIARQPFAVDPTLVPVEAALLAPDQNEADLVPAENLAQLPAPNVAYPLPITLTDMVFATDVPAEPLPAAVAAAPPPTPAPIASAAPEPTEPKRERAKKTARREPAGERKPARRQAEASAQRERGVPPRIVPVRHHNEEERPAGGILSGLFGR